MKLSPQITLVPYRHGASGISRYVRDLIAENKFDCIAVDIPELFEDSLFSATQDLPYISAVIARNATGPAFYVPVDPCDATIEAIRQSFQNQIPCFCIGQSVLRKMPAIPALPDDFAITKLGFEEYMTLCTASLLASQKQDAAEDDSNPQYIAHKLLQLNLDHHNILVLVHLRHFTAVINHFGREKTHNLSFPAPSDFEVTREFINPDHLYFALGELPYITAKFESERYDAFREKTDIIDTVKSLFTETRDNYHDLKEDIIDLSPSRLQAGLTFLRNLTLSDSVFIPSLFDIVTAAKGIGGNMFALKIFKSAKYYPYLPFELGVSFVSIGIDRMQLPNDRNSIECVNVFRDTAMRWRTIAIKPDPSHLQRQKYRFQWKPGSICSHVPEDRLIESFNSHVRKKAENVLCEDRAKSEKFSVSVKDGIDIRETMRNWFSGDIYVKELPPSHGSIDTAVIIFDEDHDELYPHRTTWYAEHVEESTLSFYATDPFADLIGPGIARSQYGGLALLFPPRSIPNIFELPAVFDLRNCAERLAYGGLLFSQEKSVAYVSAKKPGIRLTNIASKLKKRIIWIPLSMFSQETIRRLRKFHVLNGKTVRSWASRYIGER